MAEHRTEAPTVWVVSQADRIAAARGAVYDNDGEFVLPDQLGDALEECGVDVSVTPDGIPAYTNAAPEIPLIACHLAVERREDPAVFILGEAAARYT